MAAISYSFLLAVLVGTAVFFAAQIEARASPYEDAFYTRNSKPQFVQEEKSYGLFGKTKPVDGIPNTYSYNPHESTGSSGSRTTASDPSDVKQKETERYLPDSAANRDFRRDEYETNKEVKPAELSRTNSFSDPSYFRQRSHYSGSSIAGREFQPEQYGDDEESMGSDENPTARTRPQYGTNSNERSFTRSTDLSSSKDPDSRTRYNTRDFGEPKGIKGSYKSGIPMERVRGSSDEQYHGMSDNRSGSNKVYRFDPEGLNHGDAYKFTMDPTSAKSRSPEKYFENDSWDDEETP